ncbi:hypothetical protein L1987_05937 [Smallanthus sonchifolius]|uniref:Uncharacterized protein n=1 Tax=Smallanthus sonchifolius TaxID=185202 RepID=A0ACB9JWW9_9ASTR|nr:hypothetical protein L1987_05937 [Smallanthus sonchifolius]
MILCCFITFNVGCKLLLKIEKITRKDIEDYISTHYAAHRMVISASRAVKHEDVVEQIRMRDDDMPLAHFTVAFNGASWTGPDSIALMVIQAMLGSWNTIAGDGKHMGSR